MKAFFLSSLLSAVSILSVTSANAQDVCDPRVNKCGSRKDSMVQVQQDNCNPRINKCGGRRDT